MIREIKSIQLGHSYDFIRLDKYTNNKASIKIKFEDTGKDFTNVSGRRHPPQAFCFSKMVGG